MADPTPISFPFRGITDKAPFVKTPGDACPPGSLKNVRARTGPDRRYRGGSRPGLVRAFDQQIGGGAPVQLLFTVSTAARTTDYTTGSCTQITNDWEARESGPVAGQVFLLNPAFGLIRNWQDNRGGGSASAICVKWFPNIVDGVRRGFYATQFTDAGINGGQATVGLACIDDRGNTIWTANLDDRQVGDALPGSPRPLGVNAINVKALLDTGNTGVVLVAVQAVGASNTEGFIYCYRATTGTYLGRYNYQGWASEGMGLTIATDGSLLSCFHGSGAAGTLPNNPNVPPGANIIQSGSTFFRSGVMKYSVLFDNSLPLSQALFGTQLAPNARFYEASHGYFRLSEQLARVPLGAYPTAIAPARGEFAGGCVVTFSNKGWGPNGIYQPTDAGAPYSTVALIDGEGRLVWEVDSQSIRRAFTGPWGTYNNDIPDTGDPFSGNPCSLWACATGPTGSIFVGGVRNSASTSAHEGFNVFRLRQSDGAILWRQTIGGQAQAYGAGVAQGGMVVDPTDGNLLVVGFRNTKWAGSAGSVNAQVFRIDAESGAHLQQFDLRASGVDVAYGIDVDDRGLVLIATKKR